MTTKTAKGLFILASVALGMTMGGALLILSGETTNVILVVGGLAMIAAANFLGMNAINRL